MVREETRCCQSKLNVELVTEIQILYFQSRGAAELITMVEKSVCSLPYHLHLPLVTEFIKMFSNWLEVFVVIVTMKTQFHFFLFLCLTIDENCPDLSGISDFLFARFCFLDMVTVTVVP